MSQRIPVTILTGFLGSGKSTLLNHLLRQTDMADAAVIINEMGERGLDHWLVRKVEDTYIADNTLLLASGCLCCTLRTELADAMRDLIFKRLLLAIPPFQRLFIETTGLADPGPILAHLMNEETLAQHYRLDSVITTVDAVFGLQQMTTHHEARKQVAVADLLLLTKADLVSEDTMEELEARLTNFNPNAPMHRVSQGKLDANYIINAGLFDQHRMPQPSYWLSGKSQSGSNMIPMQKNTVHSHDIQHRTLETSSPINWSTFSEKLQRFCDQYGDHLLRMKGIIHASDADEPLAIHAVHHTLYPPTQLPGLRLTPPVSTMVIISQGLDSGSLDLIYNIFKV